MCWSGALRAVTQNWHHDTCEGLEIEDVLSCSEVPRRGLAVDGGREWSAGVGHFKSVGEEVLER